MKNESKPPRRRKEAKSLLKLYEIEPVHVRMARAGLSVTIRQLAELTGFDKATIVRFEMGQSVRPETASSIRTALEELGAEFFIEERTGRIIVSIPRKSS